MSIQAASLFEQFWSHYPARNGRPKVGKQPCLLLFRELEESEQGECVQAAKYSPLSHQEGKRRSESCLVELK